jgi:hypothetical protein
MLRNYQAMEICVCLILPMMHRSLDIPARLGVIPLSLRDHGIMYVLEISNDAQIQFPACTFVWTHQMDTTAL